MITPNNNRLALADDHVVQGRRIVGRQRQLISALRARSVDSGNAEDLLRAFEQTLAIFEDDLAEIAARER